MKKTLASMAFMFVLGVAQANQPVSTPAPGSVIGTATSTVYGGVSSYSTVPGVNQSASHSASSVAFNSTTISGHSIPGTTSLEAGTSAVTSGFTSTISTGLGSGGSDSYANQSGLGKVTASANPVGTTITGNVIAKSEVVVITGSRATVVDSGTANSRSFGLAVNSSIVNVDATTLGASVTTTADGASEGRTDARTLGVATPGDTVTTYAVAGQEGSYSGTVTRLSNVAVTNTVIPPCNSTTCKPPKGNDDNIKRVKMNNGFGNGDQDAPGRSLFNNNAENATPRL